MPTRFAMTALCAAALMLAAGAARAQGIADPFGDYVPGFSGSKLGDLDVLSASVTYDPTNDKFLFTGSFAAAVGTTAGGFYVWGVNRGAGTAGFAANGLPGVLFDSVLLLRPNGTGSIGANQLPAGAVTISGNTITGVVSGSLLASTGFSKSNYTFNLWPRNTAVGSGFTQIADFAPDNSNFTATVVPEPGSLALMSLGLAAGLLWRRRSSALSEAAGSPRS